MAASNSRAIVFANGELDDGALQRAAIKKRDFIVCADGGLRFAIAHGLSPNLLVGDFDSAHATDLSASSAVGVERIKHPVNKNASDLELTLTELEKRGFDEVVLLGISGGRTDHSLFNWQLPVHKAWKFTLRLIDATVDAYAVTKEQPYSALTDAGCTISLLALSNCSGVTTDGLEYPLIAAELSPGSTLGLSNVARTNSVAITTASGTLLVLINY